MFVFTIFIRFGRLSTVLGASEESFARIQLPKNVHKMISSHIKIHYIFFASVYTCISAFNFTFLMTFFDNFFIKFPKLQTFKIIWFFWCFYTLSTFLHMIVWFSNFIWKHHNFGIQTYEKSSFKSICAGLGRSSTDTARSAGFENPWGLSRAAFFLCGRHLQYPRSPIPLEFNYDQKWSQNLSKINPKSITYSIQHTCMYQFGYAF